MIGLVGETLIDGYTENTLEYKALVDNDTAGQDLLRK